MASGIYRSGIGYIATSGDSYATLMSNTYVFDETHTYDGWDMQAEMYQNVYSDPGYYDPYVHPILYEGDTPPWLGINGYIEFYTSIAVDVAGFVIYKYNDYAQPQAISYIEFTPTMTTDDTVPLLVQWASSYVEFTLGVI